MRRWFASSTRRVCSVAASVITRWWSEPRSPSGRPSPPVSWRWARGPGRFAINLPFGVLAIWIGLKTLPRTPRATHRFDFLNAALTASCLGLFIIGIGSAAHKAPPALVSAELVSAILLGWILTRRNVDHPAPMLPIDLFRQP